MQIDELITFTPPAASAPQRLQPPRGVGKNKNKGRNKKTRKCLHGKAHPQRTDYCNAIIINTPRSTGSKQTPGATRHDITPGLTQTTTLMDFFSTEQNRTWDSKRFILVDGTRYSTTQQRRSLNRPRTVTAAVCCRLVS